MSDASKIRKGKVGNSNIEIGRYTYGYENMAIKQWGEGASLKIGNGAVIAANFMVVKDIASYEIWGGNPAKILKRRFSEEIIKSLQKLKWWKWKVEIIQKLVPSLSQIPNVESIDELGKKAVQLSADF